MLRRTTIWLPVKLATARIDLPSPSTVAGRDGDRIRDRREASPPRPRSRHRAASRCASTTQQVEQADRR
jgi:hypothetical protein